MTTLFQYAIQGAPWYFIVQIPGDGNQSSLKIMLVLSVTASCSIKEPSILFYQLNDGSDFQL